MRHGSMNLMRMGLLGVVVVALVGAGYFFFFQPAAAPTTESTGGTPQGKIDINAVCEGALAYMSFPSGAEAEVFVQECKEGKHPEVIEQWKVQVGITDDRAI